MGFSNVIFAVRSINITHIFQKLKWRETQRLVDTCLRKMGFCRVRTNYSQTLEPEL
jgi:hypothetical protein